MHEIDTSLEEFTNKIINAKIHNKAACIKQRINTIGLFNMTEQEQLFTKLFSDEKILVKDMSDIELQAHIEELSDIAFKARVFLTAAKDTQKERKPKGVQGFKASVNVDETTSDAINAVKTRQSKADKMRKGLEKLGIDVAHIDKIMNARTISDTVNKAQNNAPNGLKASDSVSETNKTPLFNPFAK